MAAVLDTFEAEADTALSPRDQTLARALTRTTVRRLGDIDWALAALMDRPLPRKARDVRTVLRLAAAQLLFMRQADHAVVSTAVAMLKTEASTAGFAGLANAVLRRLSREKDSLMARLPVEANTPPWLWARWSQNYGGAVHEIAAQHREEPTLDLSFAEPPPTLGDGALRLPTGGVRRASAVVSALDGFDEGAFWVQDFAAQLPVTMLGDVSGCHVLDLCAAPGGKTMQLVAGGARVTAVEGDAGRAARLRANLTRMNMADRVDVVVGDARNAAGQYDAVLLDAPCTATGTLRRQPDVAWARSAADVTTLAKVQTALLGHAATLVAPGGRLVYATCSLEPEEGEDQATTLLATVEDVELVRPTGPAEAFCGDAHTLRTLPSFSPSPEAGAGMDGFFAAAFRKVH